MNKISHKVHNININNTGIIYAFSSIGGAGEGSSITETASDDLAAWIKGSWTSTVAISGAKSKSSGFGAEMKKTRCL